MPEPAYAPRNRTGLAASRDRSEDMLAGSAEFALDETGDEGEIARARVRSSKQSEPLGSTPPPADVDELLYKVAPVAPTAANQVQLLDKLGERLGYERMSVRVYEAVIAKFDALPEGPPEPTRMQLEHHLRDEFDNFRMLEEATVALGGDPTAVTPAADLHATMSKGVLEVLVDPRTSFTQCLEGLLTSELVDNEAWGTLVALSENAGQRGLSLRFEQARATEAEHLRCVRRWLALAQGRLPR